MHRRWLSTLLMAVVNLRIGAPLTHKNGYQCTHTAANQGEWNVTCVSHNWSTLECCWHTPWDDNTYTVTLDACYGHNRFCESGYGKSLSSLCSGQEHGCCRWPIPEYLPVVNEQTLRFTHQQGQGTYSCMLNTYAVVIPDPPCDVSVELLVDNHITISWSLPSTMKTFPPGVIANLEAKIDDCMDCPWFKLTSQHVVKQKSPVRWKLQLPYPGVTYQMRLLLSSAQPHVYDKYHYDDGDDDDDDGEGDDIIDTTTQLAWTYSQQNFTVVSDPDIPWMAVDVGAGGSFQIVENDKEQSELTVSWKPLPQNAHNGPHFRYRTTLWEHQKRIISREVFTPYVTFYNISSAVDYRVEVVCINAVGSSNISSYVVVRSNRPAPPVVQTVVRHNDTMYQMRVFSMDEGISHYTLVWCADGIKSSSPCQSIIYFQTFAFTNLLNFSTEGLNVATFADNLRLGVSAESTTGVSSGIAWPNCVAPMEFGDQAQLPSLTIKCHTSNRGSCEIHWLESCSGEVWGVLKELQFTWCPGRLNSTQDCKEVRESKHVDDSANRLLKLQGLSPQTEYTVSVIFIFYTGIIKDKIIHFKAQTEVIGLGLVVIWALVVTLLLAITVALTITSRRKIILFLKDVRTEPKIPIGLTEAGKEANESAPYEEEKFLRSTITENGSMVKNKFNII